jgi:hypothetical protein
MIIGRRCYCLLAAAVGTVVVVLKTCCLEHYPIGRWDALTWIAAIGVIVAFTICGALGCRDGSR